MKITHILATSIAAFTLGTMAQAATVVHITGSTAFRASTIQAIENLYILGPGGGNYVGAGTIAAPTGPAITAGKFKASYVGTAAAAAEQSATYVVFEGTIQGANNPVIIKTAWAGSTGGLITTANNIDVTWTATSGYLSAKTLTGAEVNTVGDAGILGGIANTGANFTGDGDTSLKADITMADSQQGSAGVTGLGTAGTNGDSIVGVVPFEWVVNNGVTNPVKFTGCSATAGNPVVTYTGAIYTPTGAPATVAQINAVVGGPCGGPNITRNDVVTAAGGGSFTLTTAPTVTAGGLTYVAAQTGSPSAVTNINANQANQMIAGGIALSQLTGNIADTAPVYVVGRNFDSGTRLSELAETGIGIFGTQQSVCPTFVGGQAYPIAFPNGGTKGSASSPANGSGGADAFISKLDLWASENIFPAPFTVVAAVGNAGYNGGGALAACLATPGSLLATSSAGAPAPLYGPASTLIGYLGRSDANTACQATVGANTAHRINFNGVADWTGGTVDSAMTAAGKVTYDNNAIQEGLYQAWEVEYLYVNPAVLPGSDKQKVADALTDGLLATPTSASGLHYGDMHVSKANEGAPIYHN